MNFISVWVDGPLSGFCGCVYPWIIVEILQYFISFASIWLHINSSPQRKGHTDGNTAWMCVCVFVYSCCFHCYPLQLTRILINKCLTPWLHCALSAVTQPTAIINYRHFFERLCDHSEVWSTPARNHARLIGPGKRADVQCHSLLK